MGEKLKYKIIKSERQYNNYCKDLEELLAKSRKSDNDKIELITLLIEKWDDENYSLPDLDPVKLLKSLMIEHGLKSKDLISILNLSKGTISKMLNYQTGLSKQTIRRLSKYFSLSQEAFNKTYKLKHLDNRKVNKALNGLKFHG